MRTNRASGAWFLKGSGPLLRASFALEGSVFPFMPEILNPVMLDLDWMEASEMPSVLVGFKVAIVPGSVRLKELRHWVSSALTLASLMRFFNSAMRA